MSYDNNNRKRKFSDLSREEKNNEEWMKQIQALASVSGKLDTLYETEKGGKSIGGVINIDKQVYTECELLKKLNTHVAFISKHIQGRFQQQKKNFKKHREASSSPLIALDPAIQSSVLSYSDPKTLICCESTSKSMKEVISNYSLWKRLHAGEKIFHQTINDELLETNGGKKQLPESEFRKEAMTAYIAQQCEEGCFPAPSDGDMLSCIPRKSTVTLFIRLSSSSSKCGELKKTWIMQGYKDVTGGRIFHPALGLSIDLNLHAWPSLQEFVAWWQDGGGGGGTKKARHERLLGLLPTDLKITILHGDYPIIATKGIDSFKIRGRRNFVLRLEDQNNAFTTLEVGNGGLCLKAQKRQEQHQQLDEDSFTYNYNDINVLSP